MSSEGTMEVTVDLLAVGMGGKAHNIARWSRGKHVSESNLDRNGLVVAGCGRLVGVFDPIARTYVTLLRGHANPVNNVAWVSREGDGSWEDERWFVSGDSGGGVCVWERSEASGVWELAWSCASLVEESVTCLGAFGAGGAEGWGLLVGSGSGSLEVFVWEGGRLVRRSGCGRGRSRMVVGGDVLDVDGGRLLVLGCVDGSASVCEEDGEGKVVELAKLRGHRSWVSVVESGVGRLEGSGVVATGGHDATVRVWSVDRRERRSEGGSSVLERLEKGEALEEEEGVEVEASFGTFLIRLEGVLSGHEVWVTGMQWTAPRWTSEGWEQRAGILTASADRSVCMWEPAGAREGKTGQGSWVPTVRLGLLGGKGGAEVLGGCMAPDGSAVLAYTYNGSMLVWNTARGIADDDRDLRMLRESSWNACSGSAGHQGPVEHVAWGCAGLYVVSCGEDRTLRVWGPQEGGVWRECARPLTHGYECRQAVSFPLQWPPHEEDEQEPHRIVLFAAEKTVRVYDSTTRFADSARLPEELRLKTFRNGTPRPLTGYIPELNLTARAVFAAEHVPAMHGTNYGAANIADLDDLGRLEHVPQKSADDLVETLTEVALADDTVWPEAAALFGHGDEGTACAATLDGAVLATACRARDAEGAALRLWHRGLPAQILGGPESTIVAIAFSPTLHGDLLAAAGKDRNLCIWARSSILPLADPESIDALPAKLPHERAYTLAARIKAHKRIIWDIAWTPDGSGIWTASRDGTVKLYAVDTTSPPKITISLRGQAAIENPEKNPVTAIATTTHNTTNLVAVGFESGDLHLYHTDLTPIPSSTTSKKPPLLQLRKLPTLQPLQCAQAIKTIKFLPAHPHPAARPPSPAQTRIAIASTDGSIRILTI